MKTANISYAKNHLSELIAATRKGHIVLIVDRRKPVATLEAVSSRTLSESECVSALIQAGEIRPATRPLTPEKIRKMDIPEPARGDILETLLAERESGR